MVRWLALCAWALVACTEAPTEGPTAPTPTASGRPAPTLSSSAALVERAGMWTEGIIDGATVRIDGAPIDAERGATARIGVERPRVGEPLLGHLDADGDMGPDGRRWEPCRVRESSAKGAVVEDRWGNAHRLAPDELARPLDPTAVGRTLAAASARRRFDERIAQSRPVRPAGWVPRRDEGVVVRGGDVYLGAKVVAVDGEAQLIRVRFDDSARRERDVDEADVVPAEAAPVEVGRLALLRPIDPTMPWSVVRVRGAGSLPEVEDRDGRRLTPDAERLRGFRPVAPIPSAQ